VRSWNAVPTGKRKTSNREVADGMIINLTLHA
jgi:hypothetical protein